MDKKHELEEIIGNQRPSAFRSGLPPEAYPGL